LPKLWAGRSLDRRPNAASLICGSGVGASVAANKAAGDPGGGVPRFLFRASGVEHDDMNVIVLGSRIIGSKLAEAW